MFGLPQGGKFLEKPLLASQEKTLVLKSSYIRLPENIVSGLQKFATYNFFLNSHSYSNPNELNFGERTTTMTTNYKIGEGL
jgi:hypothetical protein